MNKDKKNFSFKSHNDDTGEVEAVFSIFNRLDTDGDVVVADSIKSGFKDNEVPMVFAHKWDQPIGKGVITSDDEKATFRGNFFMDTEAGKEAYKLAKAMGDLQEWSFGFQTVYEVSPVLVGANRETYTLSIKSGEEAVYNDDNIDEKKLPKDVFETAEEAEKRAEQLGCSGSHTHDIDGTTYYMPCERMESYLANREKELTAQNLEQKDSAEEISEEVPTSVQGQRFSDEVKDVLAAL